MRFGLPSPERSIERMALDKLARELAEAAGVNWEELNNYPGYCKNIWLEAAQSVQDPTSAPRPRFH